MRQTRWFMCNITVIYYMFRNNVPACELDLRKKVLKFQLEIFVRNERVQYNYDEGLLRPTPRCLNIG